MIRAHPVLANLDENGGKLPTPGISTASFETCSSHVRPSVLYLYLLAHGHLVQMVPHGLVPLFFAYLLFGRAHHPRDATISGRDSSCVPHAVHLHACKHILRRSSTRRRSFVYTSRCIHNDGVARSIKLPKKTTVCSVYAKPAFPATAKFI